MEPPFKAPKLNLSEAADILNQQHPNFEIVAQTSSGVSIDQHDNQITTRSAGDFSQEEEDENTQIQASLPLYFDHLFGIRIGHSQSQISPSRLFSQSQASSMLPQCSFGFSPTSNRILDSQGFIFHSSAPLNDPISAAPLTPPPSSPSQNQYLINQPISDKSAAVLKSSSVESPATINFSSSSSTSSSPGARSNCSGTPILFPSPSSVHSRSPEASSYKIITPKLKDAQIQESRSFCNDKPAEPLSKESPHQQHEDTKGGIALCQSLRKQLTCRQGSHDSHQSACRKRRLDFDAVTSCPAGNRLKYVCPPSCTPLADCTQINRKVSMLAIVLQVNPVMEVACKGGSKAGYTVPMSSLLLGDPTKSYFKLSLWKEAAAWVERISAGDVILFKNIKLKSWQNEVVGTTIMYSSVLNLHQPKKQLPDKVRNLIPLVSLDGLMEWGRKHYGYLFDNPSLQQKSQKIVNFVASCDLGKDSLIHFRAKVLSLISNRVVLIADAPGMEIHLYLLCVDASLWHSQLSGGIGQVWEFMFIAVTLDGATQGGGYSLQTTSCSSLRPLQDDCQQATDILSVCYVRGGMSLLQTLLVQLLLISAVSLISVVAFEYNYIIGTLDCVMIQGAIGIVEVEARAAAAWFLLCDGRRLELDQMVQVPNEEMVSLLYQTVYVGCESCSRPLQQDMNRVYCQCLPCMLKKPGGYPSSAHYFRPMLICLQDSTGVVVILVTFAVIPKVLGICASQVVKASLAQSEEFGGVSETVRKSWQLVQSCDQTPPTKWIINCTISKDENSFLEAVYFTLLDID